MQMVQVPLAGGVPKGIFAEKASFDVVFVGSGGFGGKSMQSRFAVLQRRLALRGPYKSDETQLRDKAPAPVLVFALRVIEATQGTSTFVGNKGKAMNRKKKLIS